MWSSINRSIIWSTEFSLFHFTEVEVDVKKGSLGIAVAGRTRSAMYIKFCVFEFAFWLPDFGKKVDGDHVALVLLLDQIEVFFDDQHLSLISLRNRTGAPKLPWTSRRVLSER